jgi:hypothetical protein
MQESDQAIGIAVCQRVQQDGVDYAKDGGVGADPQGQGEDGQECEARRAQQSADTVAEVLGQVFEAAPAPGVAAGFA